MCKMNWLHNQFYNLTVTLRKGQPVSPKIIIMMKSSLPSV